MAANTVEIKGLRELGARLASLKADLQGDAARACTLAGAQVIKKRAKELAPVAPEPYVIEGVKVEPGNIGKNIVIARVKPRDTVLTSEHAVTVLGKKKNGYASRVGALQEFGTVKMSPQPFMRPAFDQEKGAAVDAMTRKLSERIAKAEKGG